MKFGLDVEHNLVEEIGYLLFLKKNPLRWNGGQKLVRNNLSNLYIYYNPGTIPAAADADVDGGADALPRGALARARPRSAVQRALPHVPARRARLPRLRALPLLRARPPAVVSYTHHFNIHPCI